MKDVFISYKAEEIEIAEWVKNFLEKNGVSCWMAPASIQGGSSYAVEIPKAIRECKIFVLILSTMAQQSKWVPRELDQAINANKTVMPFMVENFSLNDEFNFYLSNVQRYTAYENKMKAAEKLVKEIKSILGISDYSSLQNDNTKVIQTEDEMPQAEPESEFIKKSGKEKHSKENKNKTTGSSKKSKMKKMLAAVVAVIAVVLIFFIKNKISSYSNEYTFVDNTSGISISYNIKDDTILSFENFTFDDLKAFSLFEKSISVSFKNCDFSGADISALNNADVYSLTFDSCNLSDDDIDVLNFENINYLNLSNNQITDVSKIHGKSFKELNLSGNKISKLNFVDGLSVEYELVLDDTAITDLEGISGFRFSRLSVDNCQIKSLKGIEDNDSLVYLGANNCGLTDLDELEKLIRLEKISFRNNNIKSLDGLKNATVLSYVDLGNNHIEDISVLSKSVSKLAEVYIDYNNIESIDALRNAENLKVIKADSNKIKSFKPLSECRNLSVMSFSNNEVTDMSGVNNKSFEYLDLSFNKLESVSFIDGENHINDAVCILSGNRITSPFLPDSAFGSFRYFEIVQEMPLNFDCSPDNNAQLNILVCNFSEDVLNDVSVATRIYIVNCPLDKQMTIKNDFYKSVSVISDEEFEERHNTFINYRIAQKEDQTICQ